MTNRTVLGQFPNGESGLRVSLPGNDVLNMSLPAESLAFDSRWPSALRLISSGRVTSSTISFGETLDVEPLCFLIRKNGGFYFLVPGGTCHTDQVTGLPADTATFTFSYYVATR